MNWIKEANKLGRYHRTYEGFRFYCTKESELKQFQVEKDGKIYDGEELTLREYIAIDKTELIYKGTYWMIISKIDMEIMRRRMSKRYGEEMEWRQS